MYMRIKRAHLLSFATERGPNEPELGRAHHFFGVIIFFARDKSLFGPHSRITVDYYHYYCKYTRSGANENREI